MLTGGIIVGVLIGLNLMGYLGVFVYIDPNMLGLGALPGQYIGAALCSVWVVVTDQANRRTVAMAGALGLLTWFIWTVVMDSIGNVIIADFLGALAVAFVATSLVRRTSLPGFAVVGGATISLVPGLRVYVGLMQILGTDVDMPNPDKGFETLSIAAGIALAIAAGASLGTFFGRPAGDRLMRRPVELYRKLSEPKEATTQ
jgi:uncharacterized membrane protein YjjB (DUF3815 family)